MKKFFIAILIIGISCLVAFYLLDFPATKTPEPPAETVITSISGIKTQFIVEEPFISQSSTVTIKYNNKPDASVSVSSLQISGFDTSSVGNYSMTITYQDLSYLLNYSVDYDYVFLSNETPLPSSFFYKQTLNNYSYKLTARYYDGYKTIFLGDSDVVITNFDTS